MRPRREPGMSQATAPGCFELQFLVRSKPDMCWVLFSHARPNVRVGLVARRGHYLAPRHLARVHCNRFLGCVAPHRPTPRCGGALTVMRHVMMRSPCVGGLVVQRRRRSRLGAGRRNRRGAGNCSSPMLAMKCSGRAARAADQTLTCVPVPLMISLNASMSASVKSSGFRSRVTLIRATVHRHMTPWWAAVVSVSGIPTRRPNAA